MARINKIVIIPLILVVVLVISMSYALFTKEVSTNSRTITLKSGNKYIGIYGDHKESIEFDHEYTFTIENRGNIKAKYQIMIESITDLDLSKINYTIINGTETKTGTLSDNVLLSNNLNIGESHEIKITLTLDNTYKQSLINNNTPLNYKGIIYVNTIDACAYNTNDVVFLKTYTTASPYTWEVPCDGNYKVELWGAQGGVDADRTAFSKGGYSAGEINLQENNKFYVYIGEAGGFTQVATYNGGGRSGYGNSGYSGALTSNSIVNGYSGGGATDIRTVNGTWNDGNSLRSRIIVAAGGAGDGPYDYSSQNSSAGGLTGYKGNYYQGHGDTSSYGFPGTQTSGGAGGNNIYGASGTTGAGTFGQGGTAYNYSSGQGSGGGGGGWYGGGAGGGTRAGGAGQGGGGGSSYISGHAGCVGISNLASSTPKSGCSTGINNLSCSYSPTNYIFKVSTTKMIDGQGYSWTNVKGALQQMPNPSGGYYASGVGHSGNGYARITYLGE